MFIPKLTKKSLNKTIDLRRSPEYISGVNKIIKIEFEKNKKEMINEFNKHSVTREIEGGSGSSNISGTLGGYGNLFSFIGFDSGDKPINPIRSKLKEVYMNNIVIQRNGSFNVIVYYPKPEDIFAITPLPWAEGRSWAKGIERGLSGFGSYLNKNSKGSRSGAGIQIKNKASMGKFQNTQYITKIIKNFEAKISALNSITIL